MEEEVEEEEEALNSIYSGCERYLLSTVLAELVSTADTKVFISYFLLTSLYNYFLIIIIITVYITKTS